MKNLNIIGPEVRSLRNKLGWTQQALAEKLQALGWHISEDALSRLESKRLPVNDFQLFYLAKAFEVSVQALWPPLDLNDPELHETLKNLINK